MRTNVNLIGVKLWKYTYIRTLHAQINPRNGTKISLMGKSRNDKTGVRGPQDKVKYMHACMYAELIHIIILILFNLGPFISFSLSLQYLLITIV
jgi:hypothetical protein